jgi:gluconolactonase
MNSAARMQTSNDILRSAKSRRMAFALVLTVAFVALSISRSPAATPAKTASTLQSLIAPKAKIKLVASGLGYAEGPLWLADGRLIVSDVANDVVFAFDAAGHKSVFRRPSNIANGHALGANGSVVEAEAGDKTRHPLIARIAANGSVAVLADKFRGKHFNEPNDLIVKRDGTIWFTDPSFDLDPSAIGFYGVYRVDPKTKAVSLLTKLLRSPNGIAFSPDEKTLYVSDTATNEIASFPVKANQTLGRPRLEFGEGCDGLGVDEHGNIWATTCSSDIVVTAPSGKRIGAIPFPGSTTNLAWGGKEGKTLFVTMQDGSLYSLALTVRETR